MTEAQIDAKLDKLKRIPSKITLNRVDFIELYSEYLRDRYYVDFEMDGERVSWVPKTHRQALAVASTTQYMYRESLIQLAVSGRVRRGEIRAS